MIAAACAAVSLKEVTFLFQTWEWISNKSSNICFPLEEGGGFLALRGWIHDTDAINIDSTKVLSLHIDDDDDSLLDHMHLEEEHDRSSLPPTSDDLIPNTYDYDVVSFNHM